MSTDQVEPRNIDEWIKNLTFGYIHEIQLMFSTDNPYYIMPIDIIYICAIYYDVIDEFDPEYTPNTFKIEDNILTKLKDGKHSVMLKKELNGGCHHWKFLLLKYSQSNLTLSFGIFKTKQLTKDSINEYCGKTPNCAYIFNVGFYHKLNDHNKKLVGFCLSKKRYGEKCTTNDIIDMYLDLDKLELSYAINGKNYGVAHNIDKCQYRACINMYANACIKLVSYQRY